MKITSVTSTQNYTVHVSTPAWIVKEVVVQKDYLLLLTFANGEKRLYDAKPLLNKPLYAQLKNPQFFARAYVAGDSIAWDDELDIAPEHLYENSIPIG